MSTFTPAEQQAAIALRKKQHARAVDVGDSRRADRIARDIAHMEQIYGAGVFRLVHLASATM